MKKIPLFFALVLPTLGLSQEVLNVQSSARPMGMDIVGPVNAAGSDALSADFQDNHLPTLNTFINEQLSEGSALEDVSAIALHPNALNLAHDHDVRVYFLGEGAGYHNTLGYTTTEAGQAPSDGQLIFPDASSLNSNQLDADANSTRTTSAPVLPGDFVELGTIESGSQLDFFLISNGCKWGNEYLYCRQSG